MSARWQLLCILIVGGLVSRIAADDQQFRADRTLFKGRLLGVEFTPQVPTAAPVIRLQFLIEEAYAMSPTGSQSPTVTQVLTDWKVDMVALANVNPGNYVQSIESMFHDDVRLGGLFLVTANDPTGTGYELLEVNPATEEMEKGFVQENRAYILKYREHWHRAHLQAHSMKLKSVGASHQRQARLMQSQNPRGADFQMAQQTLERLAKQWRDQRDASIQDIENRTKPLCERLKENLEPDERQSIQQMIESSEAEVSRLREAKLVED